MITPIPQLTDMGDGEMEMNLADLLTADAIWRPRFNGIKRDVMTGIDVADRIDLDTLVETNCEFIFKDKKEKLMDYSFNFYENGMKVFRRTLRI